MAARARVPWRRKPATSILGHRAGNRNSTALVFAAELSEHSKFVRALEPSMTQLRPM